MAVTQISQSTFKQGLEKYQSFIGGYSPMYGSFESIATVTVGSGGAANIEFTSIPGTYQHLQLRGVIRGEYAALNDDAFVLRLNNDSGSNYAHHRLTGSGASATAGSGASATLIDYIFDAPGSTATANVFGAYIVDILDYASATKATTVRGFVGYDRNGGGNVRLVSGLWTSTSAVTQVSLVNALSRDAEQYSTLALYGIKAP